MACFVCGELTEVRVKRFMILWFWLVEPICRRCWFAPSDEPKLGREW